MTARRPGTPPLRAPSSEVPLGDRPAFDGLLMTAPDHGKAGAPRAVSGPSAMFAGVVNANDHANRLLIPAFFFLMAAAGSAASILAIGAGLVALALLLSGRLRTGWQRSDAPIIVSSILFCLVLGTASALQWEDGQSVTVFVKLTAFLLPPFLIAGLRETPAERILPLALLGACAGGALLFPILLAEYALTQDRVSGLAGNSGPLAITSLMTTGLAVLAFSRKRSRGANLLALFALAGGMTGLFLSGMRGSWPALPLVLAIALVARGHRLRSAVHGLRVRTSGMALFAGLAVALLALGVWLFTPAMLERLQNFQHELALLTADQGDHTSLGLRALMYEGGLQAFRQAPLLGHGLQNLWTSLPNIPGEFDLAFTHLHNIVLTVAVGAGIAGLFALAALLASPLLTAWHHRMAGDGADRLAITGILLVSFVVPGMTNIMFFHDILDTTFAFTLAVIAASVPAADRAHPGD